MDMDKAENDLRYVPDWLVRKAVKLPGLDSKVLGFAGRQKMLLAEFGDEDTEMTPARAFVLKVNGVEVLRTADGEAAREQYNNTEPISPWIK